MLSGLNETSPWVLFRAGLPFGPLRSGEPPSCERVGTCSRLGGGGDGLLGALQHTRGDMSEVSTVQTGG